MLDLDPVAAVRARHRGFDGSHAAVAVLEGRKRLVLLAGDRSIDVAKEIRERVAVALRVAGREAGERARRRILDDELRRPVGVTMEELVRALLVPAQPPARSLALEEELVLAPGSARREQERAGYVALEAQQQRCVVLERLAAELREHLEHALAGDVLRQVEPVRPEVCGDVRGARRLRPKPPAPGADEPGLP